jgi:hypothetical protein
MSNAILPRPLMSVRELVQKTWGEVYNGSKTFESLLQLRELEKMEIQVTEDRSKIMEIACDVADATLRVYHPHLNHDVVTKEGFTSYTEESQELFDNIYDEFLCAFDAQEGN